MDIGAQDYLSTWETGAQSSSALGNQMWEDRLHDKIIKVPISFWAIYIYAKLRLKFELKPADLWSDGMAYVAKPFLDSKKQKVATLSDKYLEATAMKMITLKDYYQLTHY